MKHRLSELRRHPGYQASPSTVLCRAVAWSLHCLLRIPARPRFRRWNYRLYLPAKWRGGGSTSPYLFREHYEPELLLLERFLKPGMVFIDGGANTGVFTMTAARLVGQSGRVVAFEPGGDCFAALNRSIKLNDFKHVRIRHEGLSDRTGIARLFHHHDQENSFSLGSGEGVGSEEIAIVSLDEAAGQENLTRVDFIKLDVEGAEELVMRGAEQTLAQWRPVVLLEVNPEASARLGLPPEGACEELAKHGYVFYTMEAEELERVERPTSFGNVLAVPSEIALNDNTESNLESRVEPREVSVA